MKVLEPIKIFADGRTYPEIKSGSPILLIQDGTVQIGRLNIGESYDFNMEIEHPSNQLTLNKVATQFIQNEKPEYLKSKVAIIVLCPPTISNEINWD